MLFANSYTIPGLSGEHLIKFIGLTALLLNLFSHLTRLSIENYVYFPILLKKRLAAQFHNETFFGSPKKHIAALLLAQGCVTAGCTKAYDNTSLAPAERSNAICQQKLS